MTKKQRRRKKKLQLRNKKLVKKYPFIIPRNVWTGKIPKDYDYTWTWWEFSKGWDKAFGMMYLRELGDEIKRINQKDFQILEIKEKFGQARCYTSGTSEEALEIIDKYEVLSEHVCYFCGRPDTHVTNLRWILPLCEKCFNKHHKNNKFTYEEIVCDDNPRMQDICEWKRFSKDGHEIIKRDYSDTTNKIRIWWNKNHPEDQVELYKPEVTDGIQSD